MPLSISFYTFAQLSYIIDCYRGGRGQLFFGGIYRLCHFFSYDQFRFYCVSSRVDSAASGFFQWETEFWELKQRAIFIFSWSCQKGFNCRFFDFSGYCDMVLGMAQMLNLKLPLNFNSPYKAESVSGFWDRWHMTLTRFFTKYLYFPLGGSRKGKARTCLNIMIVFLVSGLWHGANWTFLLWGLLHGAASVLERVFPSFFDRLPKPLRQAGTFLFVTLAWGIMESYPWLTFTIFLLILLVACFTMRNTQEKVKAMKFSTGKTLVTVGLLLWSILSLSEISEFLYFTF